MKYRIVLNVLMIALVSTFILSACVKSVDPPTPEEVLKTNLTYVDQTRLASDLKIIDDTLAKRSITPAKETYGVRYTVETVGTGVKPNLNSNVTVKYVGKLLGNQAIFDQSSSATFRLADLIIGWQTTFPLFPKGTKATLYIPSGYAYGPSARTDASGNTVIPSNSNLIFEIELLDVQ